MAQGGWNRPRPGLQGHSSGTASTAFPHSCILDPMDKTFEELGLSSNVLEAVQDLGYTEPTPVQEQTIPLVLEGRDVIAAAQTGTGKTAAFLLPIMSNLGHIKKGQNPICLVITPTRELAQQIDETAHAIGTYTGHRTFTVMGGTKYEPQVKAIRNGVEILVATPGRLIDLLQQKAVNLKHVRTLVIDEADRMLDMGFWPSVRKIVAQVPPTRQTLMFSATISRDVTMSVGSLLHDPAYVEIAPKGTAAETITQYLMPVERSQKTSLLIAMLEKKGAERVLVFTGTKQGADTCARQLEKAGFRVRAIHSDRSQAQRERALEQFKKGKIDILVATDVIARGIDISDVSYVYNYDVPTNPEDYVHRIGRTGRAGETGLAVTLMGPDEISPLREIEYLMGELVPLYDLEGFPYRDGRIVPNAKRSTKRTRHNVFSGSKMRSQSRRGYRR